MINIVNLSYIKHVCPCF